MFNWLGKSNSADVTPEEVKTRMAQGEKFTFVDVRESYEYREGHIDKSILIPLDQLAFKAKDIPTGKPIVVVCRSGNRSSVAVNMLQRAGVTNVLNLKGGMIAWARQGLPVKS